MNFGLTDYPKPTTFVSHSSRPGRSVDHLDLSGQKTNDLLLQILSQMKISNIEKRLWSVEDIACYMGLSVSSVRSRVICKLDFPRAIKLKGFNRRWHAREIRDWVDQFRERRTA